MRIAEAARRAERHPDTLKRLEDDRILPAPRRDFRGWRTYSEQDLAKIKVILAGEIQPISA